MTFDDLRCNAAARHWARSAPIGPSGIREPMEPVREGSIKPAPEICGKGILGAEGDMAGRGPCLAPLGRPTHLHSPGGAAI